MLDHNVLPVLPASLERLGEIRTAGTEDAAMGRNLLSMDVKYDIFMHPHIQQSGNVSESIYYFIHYGLVSTSGDNKLTISST